MRRRTILKVTASATALSALAGCVDSTTRGSAGGPAGDGSPTTSDAPTTDTPAGNRTNATGDGDNPPRPTETDSGSSGSSWGSGEAAAGDGYSVSFSTRRGQCGQGQSSAEIAFEPDRDRVAIDGTVSGSDLNTEATLGDVTYDRDAGTLRVVIGTQVHDEDAVGGQCIADLPYEATLSFDEDLPDEVTVVHDDRQGRHGVASASHDSASAQPPRPTTTRSAN
ncbi:MAG: hypothetical protein ABEJ31_01760 [Haloarculaceae archaeon]